VSSAAIAFGYWKVGQTNGVVSGEILEERRARYAMVPVLQAESDKWYVVQENEILKREAEIMKDVPHWVVGESTYLTKRWVPRHIAPLDKNAKK
jgi:NADH dehydrogenase (ubiquinone) 1 alpha subcomplex subunit 13